MSAESTKQVYLDVGYYLTTPVVNFNHLRD